MPTLMIELMAEQPAEPLGGRECEETLVPQQEGLGGVSGTSLEPFLLGFLERPFQEEVQAFVAQHAAEFCVACPDGSCPLRWTELHRQFRQLFERQLNGVVQEEGFSREDFREYCAERSEAITTTNNTDYYVSILSVCIYIYI